MKLFKGLCIFAAGALAGAAVAARVVRDKYQQEAEEEIAEMREYYRELRKNAKSPNEDKMLEEDENNKEEKEVEEENSKNEYNEIVKGYTNYTQYNDTDIKENKEEKEEEERTNYEPFIINAEEFGEDPGYDTATLTYYKDKVLTDDLDEVIDYSVAGEENLKIFDEYPDCKAIYVRDDIYRVDYEIIRDPYQYDEYNDFPDKKPHQL